MNSDSGTDDSPSSEEVESHEEESVEEIEEESSGEESEPESDDDEEQSGGQVEEDEESEQDEGGEGESKSGWADAMAKVLSVGKDSVDSKPLLLSKAKKETTNGPKRRREVGEDGEERKTKKEVDEIGRSRPDVVRDRARERKLAKIATRGVVQLFNAVREQQKSLKVQLDEAGKSIRKREKVFKNIDREGFLDVLDGGGGMKRRRKEADKCQGLPKEAVKEEPVEESSWKILRDDFMMGTKLKDWDKASDSE